MKDAARALLAIPGVALAFALVASLSNPVETAGFNLLGGQLGISQRSFKVFNNFDDATVNDNTTPQANFPGATGAVLALWKGHVEWASVPYAGTGQGDPTQTLGNGGANFDNHYQGACQNNGGGTNGNTHAGQPGNSGGVLAYMQGPISDGWMIRYLDGWTWDDGPTGSITGFDLQGVATHEIGHALGLGHSGAGGGTATMNPFVLGNGVSNRSIENDDIAGIQAIYGVKSASKPEITSLAGNAQVGDVLLINGFNFDDKANDVYFTRVCGTGTANVLGVASSNGGTQIAVTVPANAFPGEVLVRIPGSGGASLSNAFPVDIQPAAGDPPVLVEVDPSIGPAGGFGEVKLKGFGLGGAISVTFGGVPAVAFSVDSETRITATAPPGPVFSLVDVRVEDDAGSWVLDHAYSYQANPFVDVSAIDPAEGPTVGGNVVTVTGGSVLGIVDVRFGGVPAVALDFVSAGELSVVTPPGVGTVDVEVVGGFPWFMNTLFSQAYTYVAQGDFVDIGPGLGGSFGVPSFTGSGDLTPGSPQGYTLAMASVAPFAPGVLFLSLSAGAAPFKQGTFYPIPILGQAPIGVDGAGELSFSLANDASLPSGVQLVMQSWFVDATGPAGVTGTNGLRLDIP